MVSNLSESKDRPCAPGKHIVQSDGDCYECGWHVQDAPRDPGFEAEAGQCPAGRPRADTWTGPYLETPW